jgi:UDP-glucose 4-epimerase
MAKYFVTGGAGFIGLNVVFHLAAAGEKILIYDNFSTGKKKYMRDLPKDVKVVEGDVLDVKNVKKNLKWSTTSSTWPARTRCSSR